LDNAVPGFSSLHPESTLPQLSSKNLALNPTSIFDNSTNKFSDVVLKHFQNTLTYIALKKEESSRSGDYLEAKRWGEVVLDK